MIYSLDPTMGFEKANTPFTGRIKVDVKPSQSMVVLTIMETRLQDEGDFVCHVKSLTDGSDESVTQLRVFGEGRVHPVCWIRCFIERMENEQCFCCCRFVAAERPAHPTIEGVDAEIWYAKDEPVKARLYIPLMGN